MDHAAGMTAAWRAYLFTALVVSLGVFLFRLYSFGDIEPRSDQAFFSWWALAIEGTDHLVPAVGQGETLLDAMARDEGGSLTQTLRPIYNSPTELFKLLSIFLMVGASEIFGGGFATHVAVGIASSAATVFVAALFPWWRKISTEPEPIADRILAGGTALVLGATAAYPHLFSPLGPHNIGILFLLTGAVFTGKAVEHLLTGRRAGRVGSYLVLLAAQGTAFYAYKTNVFLLPSATVLFVLTVAGAELRRRVTVLLMYGTMVALLVAPIVPFQIIDAGKQVWAKDAFSISAVVTQTMEAGAWGLTTRIGQRAVEWFEVGAGLFSLPGLVGALLGLAVLWRKRLTVPACVVLAHFLVWCGVPLFAATGFRTYPYIIPFLLVGAAQLAANSVIALYGRGIGSLRAVAWATAVILISFHLGVQGPLLLSKERLAAAYRGTWREYFVGQGELRPMIAEIERTLPPGAVLMTWGYGLQYLWRVFKTPGDNILVPPAINALMLRYRDSLLAEHLARRHLRLRPGSRIFVLQDGQLEAMDSAVLGDAAATVLGPSGFDVAAAVRLVEKGRWTLRSSWPREVILFEVYLLP